MILHALSTNFGDSPRITRFIYVMEEKLTNMLSFMWTFSGVYCGHEPK